MWRYGFLTSEDSNDGFFFSEDSSGGFLSSEDSNDGFLASDDSNGQGFNFITLSCIWQLHIINASSWHQNKAQVSSVSANLGNNGWNLDSYIILKIFMNSYLFKHSNPEFLPS